MNAEPEEAARLYREGIIDLIQLHGREDEQYIKSLRKMADCPVIQAFSVRTSEDLRRAEESSADLILLDHGAGVRVRPLTGSCWQISGGPSFWPGGFLRQMWKKPAP